MAGRIRRKFVNIISDSFTEHYHGKVTDQELAVALKEISLLVARLDNCKRDGKLQRVETLRKIGKLSLEKLQEILSEKA